MNSILNDYLEQKKLKEMFFVSILAISYPEDGDDPRSLLRAAGNLFHYLEPLKRKAKKIGEILLEKGLINERDLEWALSRQEGSGDIFGKILIDSNKVQSEVLAKALSEQLSVPLLNIQKIDNNEKKLFEILPKEFIIKYKIIPVSLKERILTIGMVNPFDINAIKKTYRLTGCQTVIVQLILMHDYISILKKFGNSN